MPRLIHALKYIAPLVILILVIVGVLYIVPNTIKIGEIECSSQFGKCDEKLMLELSKNNGSSLLKAKSNVSAFLSKETYVNRFSTRFFLPQKLKVDLILKKAEFGLRGKEGQVAQVNEDGQVLVYTEDSLLPILNVEGTTPGVGETVAKDTLFALGLVSRLHNLFEVEKASLEVDGITVILKKGPKVVFPVVGDAKVLAGSLVLVINELNNSSVDPKMKDTSLKACSTSCTVDLRYKNPVVRI